MKISCFVMGGIFLVCGFLFSRGKLHIFIPYWKTLSEKEQEEININNLCLNVGVVIGLCGLIFFINGIFDKFRSRFFTLSMIIWLVIAAIDLVYINKSKRYKNNL